MPTSSPPTEAAYALNCYKSAGYPFAGQNLYPARLPGKLQGQKRLTNLQARFNPAQRISCNLSNCQTFIGFNSLFRLPEWARLPEWDGAYLSGKT
jgi:hypothetical protein